MEFEVTPFPLIISIQHWAIVVGAISLVAVGLSYLLSLRHGPKGSAVFVREFSGYLRDIASVSPMRVLAVAGLTLKEAVRRKALVVFVVFALLLMFAGWFMSSGNSREDLQAGVQIWFLLTAISWLILPVAMFLACWSIPEDIRVRSLHTVVTKPIRRIEIVLGRMAGFSGVVVSVILVMGIAGYVWIQRQVPPSVRSQLRCRVPVYGSLLFKDRQGRLTDKGINTGDIWMYRSYIEGNTQARAIWFFQDIDEGKFGDNLRLESRFEAFRTVKGSEESIEQGLEGQITLVNNLREEAFSTYLLSPAFAQFGSELLEGQFRNAATSLREVAASMTDGSNSLRPNDGQVFASSAGVSKNVFDYLGEGPDGEKIFQGVADAFEQAGNMAALIKNDDDTTAFQKWSEACIKIASHLEEHSDTLLEKMPRVEVSLPTFRVTEYHEGMDEIEINRTLRYTADYESLARFLVVAIQECSEDEQLVSGGGLAPDLATRLAELEAGPITVLNSELMVEVLQEEIDAGVLKIDDGSLIVADDRSWMTYFDQLVRSERLISQDPAGWVLTADLYRDLVYRDTLKIQVSCMNDQMFMGMARPDLFLRMPDNSFFAGYSKALLCTTLMLLLVIVIGVTASTIVKGPVAMFLTFGVFLIGQVFHGFMDEILQGNIEGGGMVESAALILQQRAPTAGVDASMRAQNLIASADKATTGLLRGASQVIPNFGLFSRSAEYVENGFDVPWSSSMLPAILTFFGFLVPCVLMGAAFLKFRELEAK